MKYFEVLGQFSGVSGGFLSFSDVFQIFSDSFRVFLPPPLHGNLIPEEVLESPFFFIRSFSWKIMDFLMLTINFQIRGEVLRTAVFFTLPFF